MIHESDLMTVGKLDGNAYTNSESAELLLNAAILRAEIDRSYEEFLEIFERFYAEDVEVSSEHSLETIRGKAQVRRILLNFLGPLHIMAEVAGLSVSIQHTAIPRDTANETHSAWTLELVGVSGKSCTVSWHSLRKWNGSRVVYEYHYDHHQSGEALTSADLSFNAAMAAAGVRRRS